MKVLVLDDDKNLHPYYTAVLMGIKNIKSVTTVATVHAFGEAILDEPHIIFCDIYMEPMRGCDIINPRWGMCHCNSWARFIARSSLSMGKRASTCRPRCT